MAGYKKYNGLDSRPKYSSSERGRARQVNHTIMKMTNITYRAGRSIGGKRRGNGSYSYGSSGGYWNNNAEEWVNKVPDWVWTVLGLIAILAILLLIAYIIYIFTS